MKKNGCDLYQFLSTNKIAWKKVFKYLFRFVLENVDAQVKNSNYVLIFMDNKNDIAINRKGMKKENVIEILQVISILFFFILLCLYHISFNEQEPVRDYLGISENNWNVIWAVSENGLLLSLAFVIISTNLGFLRRVCLRIVIPYIVVQMAYQLSCYSGIYLFSEKIWEDIWSFMLVGVIGVGIISCIK